jgi:hypothetical protein
VLERSILEKRAQARNISEYLDAEPDAQTKLYCETLIEMSFFLATGILIKLPKSSMDVLLKDVIRIIGAILLMQSTASGSKKIRSLDGIHENLMLIKDHFQIAYNLYGKDEFIHQSRSTKFLAELGKARESINTSLTHFDESLVKELKSSISVELLKQKRGK